MQCKVPLCEYDAAIEQDWPFCTECMKNTVRRILHVWYNHPLHLGVTGDIAPIWKERMNEAIQYVKDNVDGLVANAPKV